MYNCSGRWLTWCCAPARCGSGGCQSLLAFGVQAPGDAGGTSLLTMLLLQVVLAVLLAVLAVLVEVSFLVVLRHEPRPPHWHTCVLVTEQAAPRWPQHM